MGLSRNSIKVFFKPPLKKNIFQEVASIKRLSYRYTVNGTEGEQLLKSK